MAICPVFDPSSPYISSITAWLDCRMLAVISNGYLQLGPTSFLGTAWTGLLTIAVALFAYGLLLDGRITLRETVASVAKIGFVLALAGQWPAYQTVMRDTFVWGADELADTLMGSPSASPTLTAQLAPRVDAVSASIAEIIKMSSAVATNPQSVSVEGSQQAVSPNFRGLSSKEIEDVLAAGNILSITALSGLVGTRLVMSILLGLGPIFLACILFTGTRGFFFGWLRGMAAAALTVVLVTVSLSVELTILEPQLNELRELVLAAKDTVALVAAIRVTTMSFFAANLIAIAIGLGVAFAIHLPTPRLFADWAPSAKRPEAGDNGSTSIYAQAYHGGMPPPFAQFRQQAVAEAMHRLDSRDAASLQVVDRPQTGPMAPSSAGLARHPAQTDTQARRASFSGSATAHRRDNLK